ncbi:hypothetical protein EVAR_59982_1 [Eumeta japonica]|uniref:Uncharacterized protein n=1 Tax=Eumeta variegata TaxID=151549 RepID=A0A4C2ABF2_EUMVA|nr:hypothetical protein EVAR_59982_1 [Eumeta japonica]
MRKLNAPGGQFRLSPHIGQNTESSAWRAPSIKIVVVSVLHVECLRACGACRVTPGQAPETTNDDVKCTRTWDHLCKFAGFHALTGCDFNPAFLKEEDVSNNITDDDEDGDDSVGQYHDWLNDEIQIIVMMICDD